MHQKNKASIIILLFFVILFSSYVILADSSLDIHSKSFEKVLNKAANNSFYKYGIYSSRIITVKYPEVYLQGDMYFAKLITSHKGYEQWYKVGTASGPRNYKWGTPFSFDLVNFNDYNIKPNSEIYNHYPIFDYIDERISSIQTVLKVKDVTSLEAANLIYIKKRIEGSPEDDTFLIFTKDKQGYVYSDGSYFDCLGQKVISEKINHPILVFNERNVWYPLMERDDTATNPELNKIVKSISTSDNVPELNQQEKEIINHLKEVSILTTAKEKEIAALTSIHSSGYDTIAGDVLYNKWHKILLEINFDTVFMFSNLLITKIGTQVCSIKLKKR
ncbi:MAG: hypothetical protein PWR10_1751 [Halanaerobiales bacterium]|nr:hypothetical protein [Halanaerobiales bacterium]